MSELDRTSEFQANCLTHTSESFDKVYGIYDISRFEDLPISSRIFFNTLINHFNVDPCVVDSSIYKNISSVLDNDDIIESFFNNLDLDFENSGNNTFAHVIIKIHNYMNDQFVNKPQLCSIKLDYFDSNLPELHDYVKNC